MANTYTINTEVEITATFRNSSGVPATPADAPKCAVTDPEGTTTVYTASTTPAFSEQSTGIYTLYVLGNIVGRWHYNPYVDSSGYPTTDNDPIAEEGSFIIETAEGQSASVDRIVTAEELHDLLGLGSSPSAQELAALSLVHAQSESIVIGELGYSPVRSSRTQHYPLRDSYPLYRGGSYWDVNTAHTRAQLISPNRNRYLQLRNIPLRSITSLKVDENGRFNTASGAFGSGTSWTEGEDYFPEWEQDGLCESGILHAYGGWPVELGSVRIVYVGGYSKAEFNGASETVNGAGIKRAVMLTAVKAFQTWMQYTKKSQLGFVAGPLKSEKLGDYSYTLGGFGEMLTSMHFAIPAEAREELGPYLHYGLEVL